MQQKSAHKILIIATEGLNTNLLIETLSSRTEEILVIYENSESLRIKFKRRTKKLGFFKAFSQVLFIIFVARLLKKNKRIKEILALNELTGKAPNVTVQRIASINDGTIKKQLSTFHPDLVVINGTRIIKAEILNEFYCPVVNIHVGITPKYRGVHGGYWALYQNDAALFGATLHFVDKGIDTGKVIDQKILVPDPTDNFATYPVLQYCGGLQMLSDHLESILANETDLKESIVKTSELHYHPGFFQYWRKRIVKGIK